MFESTGSNSETFVELDLGSKFDTSNVIGMRSMFYNITYLTTIYVPDSFTTVNVENSDDMFTGSSSESVNVNDSNLNSVNCSTNNEKGTIVSGLKGAVNSCGKLYLLTQSLASLAENIGRLFNSDQEYYTQPYNNDPWFSGGYNYGNGYNNGWSRINPYVIQSSPQGPIFNNGNNYPF
jgi:hypothetical protein